MNIIVKADKIYHIIEVNIGVRECLNLFQFPPDYLKVY